MREAQAGCSRWGDGLRQERCLQAGWRQVGGEVEAGEGLATTLLQGGAHLQCNAYRTAQPIPVACPTRPALQIDSGAAAGMVDSLNVSVATGILLHRLLTAQEPGNSGGGAGGGGAAAAAEGGDGAAAEASAAVTEPAV